MVRIAVRTITLNVYKGIVVHDGYANSSVYIGACVNVQLVMRLP